MKETLKKKILGSITVLLVIIMLPMMTLSAVIVDSSRINMSRSMVSSAGDLAMNTALANYDTVLKDVYGLFAMSQDQTEKELEASIKEYFKKTLVSYGVTTEAESDRYVDELLGDVGALISGTGNISISNFLNMSIPDSSFNVTKVENSSLANPSIMRKQIVEYMKYRAPLTLGLSFLDSIKAFSSAKSQMTVVEKRVAAQESTQDVSKACKAVIDAIREYDKLINDINGENGKTDKTVTGKDRKDDQQDVKLENYHTQLDKYGQAWADNYYYANRIALVFLLNSPSTKDLYLKKLNVNTSQWFVKTDNSGIIYDNTGINVSVTGASDTSGANEQVYAQIARLNDANSPENKTLSRYTQNFLDSGYLTNNDNAFSNETKAIETFTNYERFILNENNPSTSLNYDDVRATIENIYITGKYYDNYILKINAEISKAESAKTKAEGDVTSAITSTGNYYSAIQKNVENINNANKNFATSYAFLDKIKNSDNENLKTVVGNILAQNTVQMPTTTEVVSGQTFTDFSGFANKYIESKNDTDNKYLKVFKEIINSSLKNNNQYKDVCTAATNFLKDTQTKLSFSEYVKKKSGQKAIETDFFKLLQYLYTNSGYAQKILDNISNYNDVVDGYSELVDIKNEKIREHNEKTTDKKIVTAKYTEYLSKFNSFVKFYQNDLQEYDRYIAAAKNIVKNTITPIKDQYTLIKTNISTIISKLKSIEEKLKTAYEQIEAYEIKVVEWNSANESYSKNNGADSFSKQNVGDIENTKTEYNKSSAKILWDFVISVREEYEEFYNYITGDGHFSYGSKKIDTIATADDMVAAADAMKSQLPSIVTTSDANSKFGYLYSSDETPAIEPPAGFTAVWKFLEPVLPIQFLKYLNETYPKSAESSTTTVKVGEEAITVGEGGDFDYNSKKSDLVKNSGESISDETVAGDYGYSYSNRDLEKIKATLPSKDSSVKTVNTQAANFSEDNDGDINASKGLNEQTSTLSTLLSGIENVATSALENCYILSYIFNNFSYNTEVQGQIINTKKDLEKKAPWDMLSEAKSLLNKEKASLDNYTSYTLSNVPKNSSNNYLYGAEIEYLLYGNTKASTNVAYAKASIYAIRFAFNCIYAFTNSEIRNSTMSVGLAVQAATCGFVPYQVVQIVLQLALAAAESALDLDAMNQGLTIAVVKTSDTWALSLTNAIKSVGNMAATAVEEVVTKVAREASAGLQSFIDSTSENIVESVNGLSLSLTDATEAKLEEVIDAAFSQIQSKIDEVIDSLQYVELTTKAEAVAKIETVFSDLESTLANEVTQRFSGNPVAEAILPSITGRISQLLESAKSSALTAIDKIPSGKSASEVLISKITEIKLSVVAALQSAIDSVSSKIGSKATELTTDISDKLSNLVSEKTGELTDKAAEDLKKAVTEETNNFISSFLNDGQSSNLGTGIEGASGSTSSSVASMIRFGYKDYMMLFVYISLCVNQNDNATISRIADLIELNIQNAKTESGASYQHKLTGISGGTPFKMANAKTYISINAKVKLDMMFLNMEFFTNIMSDSSGETAVKGELTPSAEIEYNGLYGY